MLTEKAANKIKEISEEEGIGHFSVRVKLSGGGCAGLQRAMDFDNSPKENDTIIEMDGVRVMIDEVSGEYMSDATLDYKGGLMESGFIFTDPNQISSCGCGKSVGY